MGGLLLPLAQMTGTQAADPYRQWLVLGIVLLVAFGFALGNLVLSSVVGPSRKGGVKDAPYESGMYPVGDTHRRFNVRFYMVAMIFLVFDVEVLFFIPWVTIFPHYRTLQLAGLAVSLPVLFGVVITFTAVVLLAYVYAWAKDVLRWD